ncbi:MAG: SCO family protein [Candidatus Sericytochromatia bacterium]
MTPGQLIGLALVGAALVVAPAGPAWALQAPPTPSGDCCKPMEPAAPVADLLTKTTLTDQFGKQVSLPDGRVWVVTFFYGNCKDVCPTLLYNLGSVAESLPKDVRDKVGFAGISFDPERDTVAKLAEYQENFELTGADYHLMIADKPTLDRVFTSFRFSFKPDRDEYFQHVNLLAVMDGQGRVIKHYYGLQPNIEQVTALVEQTVKSSPQK